MFQADACKHSKTVCTQNPAHTVHTHAHLAKQAHTFCYCAGVRRDKSMCTLGEGTTKSDSNQILFMQSTIVSLPVIYDIAPEKDNSLQNTN